MVNVTQQQPQQQRFKPVTFEEISELILNHRLKNLNGFKNKYLPGPKTKIQEFDLCWEWNKDKDSDNYYTGEPYCSIESLMLQIHS